MKDVLSLKDLLKIGLRGFKDNVDYNWHGKLIKINTLLSFDDEISTIQSIIEYCYDDIGNRFMPSHMDMAFRTGIIRAYTSVELPDNIEDLHNILYATDLYDSVIKVANSGQISAITNAVKMIIGGNYG